MELVVTSCIGRCPFYGTEQGGLMYCGHPNAKTMEDSYIIHNDDVIPEKCHLRNNSVTVEVNINVSG